MLFNTLFWHLYKINSIDIRSTILSSSDCVSLHPHSQDCEHFPHHPKVPQLLWFPLRVCTILPPSCHASIYLLTSCHSRLLGIFWKYVLTYMYEMHLNAYSGWISSCSVTPWFTCAAEPLTRSFLPTAVTSQSVCVLLLLDMLVLYRSWLLYIKPL